MSNKKENQNNICPVCKDGKLKKLNKQHLICTNPNCYQFFEVTKKTTVTLKPVE